VGEVRDGGRGWDACERLEVEVEVETRARVGGRGRRRSMASAGCDVGAGRSERGDAVRRVITKKREE